MKVRAVAAKSRESSAIGTLECECTPRGLVLHYLAVATYQEGYAPGPVTSGVRKVVPWPEVLSVEPHEEAIWLELGATAAPHHRLLLTSFAAQSDPRPQELRKRRLLVRGATALLALVLLSAGPPLLADSPAATYSGSALLLATLGAIALVVVALFTERLWLSPSQPEPLLRQRFLDELRQYYPRPFTSRARAEAPPFDWAALLLSLPRSTAGVAIVLTAGSLAAVVTSSWLVRGVQTAPPRGSELPSAPPRLPRSEPPAPGPSFQAAAGPDSTATAPTPTSTVPASPAPAARAAGDCQCERATSPLWEAPFPLLSTLVISERLRAHKGHHHVELELGLVNNSRKTLPDASLLVRFFEDHGTKPTKERHLYYEGRMRPGQAVKWHVESRGTSFVIENPKQEELASSDLAPADALAALLSANHRPVRLHGALMLTYLGDLRGRAGTEELAKALREDEAPLIERLRRAQGDVVACDMRSSGKGRIQAVDLCVYNRTLEPKEELAVQLRALEDKPDPRNPVATPPQVLIEKVYLLPGAFDPQSGRWVSVTFDTNNEAGKVPAALEAFVDERRLLY